MRDVETFPVRPEFFAIHCNNQSFNAVSIIGITNNFHFFGFGRQGMVGTDIEMDGKMICTRPRIFGRECFKNLRP